MCYSWQATTCISSYLSLSIKWSLAHGESKLWYALSILCFNLIICNALSMICWPTMKSSPTYPHTIHQVPRNWRCRRTWIDYDAVGIVNTLLSEVRVSWLAAGWDYSIQCGDSGVNVAASLDYNYLQFLLCVTFVACVNLGMLEVLLDAWYCLLCFTGKWC